MLIFPQRIILIYNIPFCFNYSFFLLIIIMIISRKELCRLLPRTVALPTPS